MTKTTKPTTAPRRKRPKDFVDRRRLAGSARPKPTTGQSAPARELAWDQLGQDERDVLIALDGGKKRGERHVRSIAFLADALEGEEPRLRARNALRRPVSSRLVARVSRGHYQITEAGRRAIP